LQADFLICLWPGLLFWLRDDLRLLTTSTGGFASTASYCHRWAGTHGPLYRAESVCGPAVLPQRPIATTSAALPVRPLSRASRRHTSACPQTNFRVQQTIGWPPT